MTNEQSKALQDRTEKIQEAAESLLEEVKHLRAQAIKDDAAGGAIRHLEQAQGSAYLVAGHLSQAHVELGQLDLF